MGSLVLNNPWGDKTIVTRADVMQVTGIGDKRLRDMIEKGQFPRPFTIPGSKGHLFHALEVACWLILQGRMEPGPCEEES